MKSRQQYEPKWKKGDLIKLSEAADIACVDARTIEKLSRNGREFTVLTLTGGEENPRTQIRLVVRREFDAWLDRYYNYPHELNAKVDGHLPKRQQ